MVIPVLLWRNGGSILLSMSLVLVLAALAVVNAYDTIDGHPCFRNLQGITDSMNDLANQYPDLSTVADIGDSYLKSTNSDNKVYNLQGGYDIYAMNITASEGPHFSSAKGKILIISGVHPREFAPPELVMRFAESLLNGYGVNSDITWLLQHTEVHLIFHVNPDGRYVTENYQDDFWRKNLNPSGDFTSLSNPWSNTCSFDDIGVDINRNYDFMWGDDNGSSPDPCKATYHGRSPHSETETQAVVKYARNLFPSEQRKSDPEKNVDVPLGEDIMGIFVDVHAPGGYIVYPWGYDDIKTADDDALQALGRKLSYFNGYKLWAGGQPDFLYAASGDSTDYMYGVLGVASLGLELGEDFYEDCDLFENVVVPDNLPALLYVVSTAKKPFSLAKGPDILEMVITQLDASNGQIRVRVASSDSVMVNSIDGYPDFPETGDQGVTRVQLYLDVHPDDYKPGNSTWEMQPIDNDGDGHIFGLDIISPKSGQITLYAQAMDSAKYWGPVSSASFNVEKQDTAAPSKGSTASSSSKPTDKPTPIPISSTFNTSTEQPTNGAMLLPLAPTTLGPTTTPVVVPPTSGSIIGATPLTQSPETTLGPTQFSSIMPSSENSLSSSAHTSIGVQCTTAMLLIFFCIS